MTTIGYSDVLYRQRNGLDDIVRASKGMVAKTGARINAFLFSCDGDPAKEFVEWAPPGRHPRVAKKGGKHVLSIDGRDGVPVRVAVAGDSRTPSIRCALSDCPSALFKGRFVSLVGRPVTSLSRIVLSNAEIVEILDGIAKKDLDVKVKYASVATRRRGGGFDSRADHMDEPCGKFLATLGEEDAIKTIRIECRPAGLAAGAGASGRSVLTMTRDCRFSAVRNADVLFDHVLPRAAKMAESRVKQIRFSARTARRRTPEPLIINYGRDVFADPRHNKNHIAALASLPRSGISVYHSDSYLHTAIVDYSDGSSYNIWILVGDKLAIIPQIYASESSMGRLVSHIFENIGGGRIERYEKGGAGR